MSNNAHIDKIFKEGLDKISNPGVDAMWQKMEGMIDNDGRKKKKRFAFIILFACLLIAGFFIAVQFNKQPDVIAETKPTPSSKINSSIVIKNIIVPVNPISSSSKPVTASILKSTSSKRSAANSGKQRFVISTEKMDEVAGTIAPAQPVTEDLLVQKMSANAELLPLQYLKKSSVAIAPVVQKTIIHTTAIEPVKQQAKAKKISIEAIAGCDALRMNRRAGYYVGIRFNKLLEKGTVISIGINYTSNTVNDKYRLSSKPAEQRWETDAKINDIRSIRVPIYFQRQLANSKFALMAGLVPTYVIDATAYNVQSSFTGNPNGFRKFTMKDMNRFNILFGTGIKYSPINRLSFELSGSYGFTSLVKNSYINQSRVNDNFKSIQAGLVFTLK